MNIDRKFVGLVILLIAILLMLLFGIAIAKEAPGFNTARISGISIAKNWPFNRTDRITLSSQEFTCQPDTGTQGACEVMLEGKRLDMTYSLDRFRSVTECTVVYGGTPYACEVTLGYGWKPMLKVNTDMGISAAQMADLRAQRPLIYMAEGAWMAWGIAWSAVLAFLTTLFLLTLFNKIPVAELQGIRLPLWLLCLVVIAVAALVNQVTGMMLMFPLGMVGTVMLLVLIRQINRRDRKHGPSLAHPLMWASVSLAAFWGINLAALMVLMRIGFID